MIRAVSGSSIAASVDSDSLALRRFAQGLRWRHVFSCTVGAGIRWGLLLSLPVVLLAWLWPAMARQALVVVLAVLVPIMLVAALRAFWHSRRIFSALRQSLAGGGGEIAALHDELLTWLEVDARRGANDGATADRESMLRWLERDVQQRLQPHRKRALAAVSRPRLGRWRWLVPALLVLLLLWLVAWLVSPPWSGALGGQANQPEQGSDDGQGGQGQEGDREPGSSPPPQGPGGEQPMPPPEEQPGEQPGDRPEPQPVQPVPEPQSNESPSNPEEVPPMIDLPDDQRFVVPEFIGDGPTRRKRMHAAEVEEQADAGAAATGTSGAANQERPQQPEPDFERAAEAALRSRHVPPSERGMVRRFFDKLQSAARSRDAARDKADTGGGPAGKSTEGQSKEQGTKKPGAKKPGTGSGN